ncbi:MAG: type II toxin-antitoxin system HicA family toxin [Aquabacterium sp.]|nr:type II toxin-antitoxin system HicA family toxin [Aquabacterium sp.]
MLPFPFWNQAHSSEATSKSPQFHHPHASVQCLHLLAKSASIPPVNTKQRKTLRAIFARPTSSSLVFSDIEALFVALGGEVHEREGSRVKIILLGEQWRCHRPHPGKEAKRYQVEEARELLERVGVQP